MTDGRPTRQYGYFKPRVALLVLILLVGGRLCSAGRMATTITIDDAKDPAGTVAKIALSKGDKLTIAITHTSEQCYEFNLKSLVSTAELGKLTANQISFSDTVTFRVIYDGEVGYKIDARLKPGLHDQVKKVCEEHHGDRTWYVEVEHESWQLAITGAFTADDLTDPVYFLEATTRTVTDAEGGQSTENGYVVRRNEAAENRFTLGAAAMVHLFHERLGGETVKWAPVSFGIGVNGDSNARYYLGTSARFGEKLYLTGGLVAGSVARLPANLAVGSFTADPNALGTLGTRTDAGWFLAVSLSLADVDVGSIFRKPFAQPTPDSD